MAFLQLHKPPLLALLLLLCCCLEPTVAMAGAADSCLPSDLQALRAFAPHIELASDNLAVPRSLEKLWGPKDNCCSWQGINCSVDGTPSAGNGQPRHVSSLVLVIESFSNLSFTSNFLQPLCNLSHLSTLYLEDYSTIESSSSPQFFTAIPACLGHLSALRVLVLNSLRLQGPFPSSFSHLLHLQDLQIFNMFDQLAGCRLSGNILPISNLPNLTSVVLGGCGLSGPLPPFQTPFLQHLDLSYNSLGLTLDNFTLNSSLPSLTDLLLSGNTISGSIPPSVSRLSSLSTFLADSNFLSGEISDSICKLANLSALDLSGQSAGRFNTSLDSLECSFINLTFLSLAGNGLMGPFPRWIGRSPSLQTLDLSYNLFRGPLPEEWRNLQQLEDLDLSGNSILSPRNDDARLPAWLFHFPLQYLTLASCGLQTRDLPCGGKLALLNQSLFNLTLSDNHLTGGSILECIALHNFSQIYLLKLSGNPLSIVLSNAHFSGSILILSSCSLKGVEVNSPVKSRYVDLSRNGLAMDLTTLLVGLGLHSNCSPSNFYFGEGIDLSHNALVGEIPSFLGLCNNGVESIRLHNNSLVGHIPATLGNLTALETLTLNNNQLNGTIPASIINISNLILLDLSYNELEGDINRLFSVSQTMLLRVVLLSHNRFHGSIPMSFGTFMPNLQVIDFSYNRLTGTIPQRLNLPYLQSLQAKDIDPLMQSADATGNLYMDFLLMIKGVELPYSYVLKTMTSFDLSSNSIEGKIPAELGSLAGLLFLNLSHNQLSGPIPGSLTNLSKLQALDLSWNELAGPLPSQLSSLTDLAVFNVSYNPGLAGRIPQGTQFESNNSYIGNPQLCGRPALQDCKPSPIPDQPPPTEQSPPRSALSQWIDEWIELPALALGLVVGFATTLFFLHY